MRYAYSVTQVQWADRVYYTAVEVTYEYTYAARTRRYLPVRHQIRAHIPGDQNVVVYCFPVHAKCRKMYNSKVYVCSMEYTKIICQRPFGRVFYRDQI